ncbi:plasmid segregation protein ParM domain-containing protein [Rosenbergiella collisarenosi]|uniref:plasmid segregation protein ParM domain-containing protein n=1 Tax=Rosenbergiella collisarenosi TaxID=1544695 RepID=UPI001F4DE536|nr:plasmid segregation protein ParM domain-containing protein [Rosenbergiella collisarenosi]
MQKVFIDDGSTHVKMIWRDAEGEQHLSVTPNTFTAEHAPVHTGKEANYTVGKNKFSFSKGSSKTIPTTDTSFQYSEVNAVAIHHALHESGLTPQPVDIIVTLPLSEFYDQENNKNTQNIERKKENYKKSVKRTKRDEFTINSVTVLPESIPAGINIADTLSDGQSLLIIDIGGTTTNIGHIAPQLSEIYQQKCLADTGVSRIISAVKSYLSRNEEEMADITIHTILKKRNDRDYLESVFNDESNIDGLYDVIATASESLSETIFQTVKHFNKYTHVMLCGGGGALTKDSLRELTKIKSERFFVSENPQIDLVQGIETLG